MLPKDLNDLLTLTGPEQPMGQFMRRYWLPALLSEEIPAPDSPPVQVRLLGEELVAFRDSNGRVGLLDEHCGHRGTSLFYGRNEECGLRCIYHGWKYNVDGDVVDTPAEPSNSEFKTRIHHPSYPVKEVAGVVFAYPGPPQKVPVFPSYEWAQLPLGQTYVTKSLLACNYLQGVEGECDSSHLSFLHREFGEGGSMAYYAQDTAPVYEMEETDFGLRLIALRQTNNGDTYVRVSSFVLPTGAWVPARNREIHIYVPIDDTHSWRYDMGFLRDRVATPADNSRRLQIDSTFRRFKNPTNYYMQDRQVQRASDFTGIDDFLNEDACATESMGARYDRSKERLGMSDKGVIAMRRYLIDQLQAFQNGAEPPHILTEFDGPRDMGHIDTFAQVIPAGTTWRERFPHLRTTAAPADAPVQKPLTTIDQ